MEICPSKKKKNRARKLPRKPLSSLWCCMKITPTSMGSQYFYYIILCRISIGFYLLCRQIWLRLYQIKFQWIALPNLTPGFGWQDQYNLQLVTNSQINIFKRKTSLVIERSFLHSWLFDLLGTPEFAVLPPCFSQRKRKRKF